MATLPRLLIVEGDARIPRVADHFHQAEQVGRYHGQYVYHLHCLADHAAPPLRQSFYTGSTSPLPATISDWSFTSPAISATVVSSGVPVTWSATFTKTRTQGGVYNQETWTAVLNSTLTVVCDVQYYHGAYVAHVECLLYLSAAPASLTRITSIELSGFGEAGGSTTVALPAEQTDKGCRSYGAATDVRVVAFEPRTVTELWDCPWYQDGYLYATAAWADAMVAANYTELTSAVLQAISPLGLGYTVEFWIAREPGDITAIAAAGQSNDGMRTTTWLPSVPSPQAPIRDKLETLTLDSWNWPRRQIGYLQGSVQDFPSPTRREGSAAHHYGLLSVNWKMARSCATSNAAALFRAAKRMADYQNRFLNRWTTGSYRNTGQLPPWAQTNVSGVWNNWCDAQGALLGYLYGGSPLCKRNYDSYMENGWINNPPFSTGGSFRESIQSLLTLKVANEQVASTDPKRFFFQARVQEMQDHVMADPAYTDADASYHWNPDAYLFPRDQTAADWAADAVTNDQSKALSGLAFYVAAIRRAKTHTAAQALLAELAESFATLDDFTGQTYYGTGAIELNHVCEAWLELERIIARRGLAIIGTTAYKTAINASVMFPTRTGDNVVRILADGQPYTLRLLASRIAGGSGGGNLEDATTLRIVDPLGVTSNWDNVPRYSNEGRYDHYIDAAVPAAAAGLHKLTYTFGSRQAAGLVLSRNLPFATQMVTGAEYYGRRLNCYLPGASTLTFSQPTTYYPEPATRNLTIDGATVLRAAVEQDYWFKIVTSSNIHLARSKADRDALAAAGLAI